MPTIRFAHSSTPGFIWVRVAPCLVWRLGHTFVSSSAARALAGMTHQTDNWIHFGTTESLPEDRQFSAGALSLHISDGAVRRLCWHGVEVVRGIACPIRDSNWATCISVLAEESVTETPAGFEVRQVRLVANDALRVELVFKGSTDGTFQAVSEISVYREYITNRAGFTLLHPLQHIAGTPLSVAHPDGLVTVSEFPLLISPHQVAAGISALRHVVNGIDVDITFHGEIFEMEDQRNWSDASFKTYCRPLSLPRPYRLNAGEIHLQEIAIRFQGTPAKSPGASASTGAVLEWRDGAGTVPRLAVAIEDGTLPGSCARGLYRLLKPAILQLRVTPQTAAAVCESAKELTAASLAEIELEIVVPSTDDPQRALARVAADCKKAPLAVARVLALPESYLQCYQPGGPWPAGPTPRDLLPHARAAFSDAGIGSGVLTYFPELNRCRPGPCDYVTHGATAITQSADDHTVIENLEGLSHVLKSGRALAGERDYRLGLVAIGMRSNPYGSGIVENVRQNRVSMAGADPRQRGLFAAAWAVGAVAATEGHGVSSMALSALVGPFGAIYRREAW
ncbi:MAG: hypothetical protein NTX21_06545, partial [Alphaproteobacteria bacterium]|nr:hypothetical protein [Alphaproteobacteria bacterium]